jgi:hypothetical protein
MMEISRRLLNPWYGFLREPGVRRMKMNTTGTTGWERETAEVALLAEGRGMLDWCIYVVAVGVNDKGQSSSQTKWYGGEQMMYLLLNQWEGRGSDGFQAPDNLGEKTGRSGTCRICNSGSSEVNGGCVCKDCLPSEVWTENLDRKDIGK